MNSPNHKVRLSGAPTCLRRYAGGQSPQVRLVCFPWAGGGASAYKRLAAYLPGSIEMLAVQYPGREERYNEPRLLRMELIVQTVVEDIIAVFDRPLVLFGHSMGALVAYEVAQAIKARLGREPRMLIVSGSGSPDTQASNGRCSNNVSDEEFIADLRGLDGTPREILDNPPMMRTLLPLLRADYEVLDNYVSRHASTLSCGIVACCGDQDLVVSNASLSAWRNFTTGPYRQSWFRGDHFYFSSAPERLAARLREWIEQGVHHCQLMAAQTELG